MRLVTDMLVSSSSSSFYLPNSTAVRASTWIQLREAGQQSLTRTLTAARKHSLKSYGVHNYYTSKILQTNKKTGKAVFSMLFLKHF